MLAYQINAFTKDGAGGNPAGVVLGHLSSEAMQAIACDLGFSETVFIKQDPLELRYFTPTTEIDMCGHATLAAFAFLLEKGEVTQGESTFRNQLGLFRFNIRSDRSLYLRQDAARFYESVEKALLAPILGLAQEVMIGQPQIVSTGLRDLFIEVRDVASLDEIRLDEEACTHLSNAHEVTSFHVFAMDEHGQLHARNFGPAVGIPEESATGSSSGALAVLLFKAGRVQKNVPFSILQGEAMHKTSLILVELGDDEVPWVGGYCSPSVRVR